MKKHITTILLISALAALGCDGSDTDGTILETTQSSTGGENSIELNTIDGFATLLTEGEHQVQGAILDTDEDGSPDGIDITGNDELDIIYIQGSLGKTGAQPKIENNQSFEGQAFYYAGDSGQTVYYFSYDENNTLLTRTADENAVQIVMADGEMKGIDTDGDGIVDDAAAIGSTDFAAFYKDHAPVLESCIAGTWQFADLNGNESEFTFFENNTFEATFIHPASGEKHYDAGSCRVTTKHIFITYEEHGMSTDTLDAARAASTTLTSRILTVSDASCSDEGIGFYTEHVNYDLFLMKRLDAFGGTFSGEYSTYFKKYVETGGVFYLEVFTKYYIVNTGSEANGNTGNMDYRRYIYDVNAGTPETKDAFTGLTYTYFPEKQYENLHVDAEVDFYGNLLSDGDFLWGMLYKRAP